MKLFLLSLLPKKIKNKLILSKYGYKLLTDKNYFLHEMGYTQSFIHKKPITKEGEYIPWMNYSIINFLNERLNKLQNIFEYGSGFSTIFYAKKVNSICLLEYDDL